MQENPYIATAKEFSLKKGSNQSGRWLFIISGLILLLFLFFLLLPATRRARPAAYRMSCSSNMRNIAIALNAYEQEHGCFPPAHTTDESGQRLHSWRSLILPYLDQKELYSKIDFSKPWNHPDNEFATKKTIPVYTCPATKTSDRRTTYVGILGEHCAFQGTRGRKLTEVIDGISNTILLVEVEPARAIHWMCPEDATMESLLIATPDNKKAHYGGSHAAFFDAAVRFITSDIDQSMLEGLFTIDSGEINCDSSSSTF